MHPGARMECQAAGHMAVRNARRGASSLLNQGAEAVDAPGGKKEMPIGRAYGSPKCPAGSRSSQIAGYYMLRDALLGASQAKSPGTIGFEMPGGRQDKPSRRA